jgi:hypothetical protein
LRPFSQWCIATLRSAAEASMAVVGRPAIASGTSASAMLAASSGWLA